MVALFYIVFIFITAYALEDLLKRNAGIGFSVKLDRKTAEADEIIELRSTITNSGRIPLNYIQVTEQLPTGNLKLHSSDLPTEKIYDLDFYGYKPEDSVSAMYHMYMRPMSAHTVTRQVSFGSRGRYVFHGAVISRGDFLGIDEITEQFDTYVEAVILPRRAEPVTLPDLMSGLIGDYSVRRFIHEDPVLTIGYREYTGREPMKAISWAQTARMGQLIVKKYDYTTDLTVSVILNTECDSHGSRVKTSSQIQNIEYAISLTRTVCEYLDERRIPYSYTTNAAIYGGRRIRLSMRSGFGTDHLDAVLENLGRTGYEITERFADTISGIHENRFSNTAFVIITAERTSDFDLFTSHLKNQLRCLVLDASELIKEDNSHA